MYPNTKTISSDQETIVSGVHDSREPISTSLSDLSFVRFPKESLPEEASFAGAISPRHLYRKPSINRNVPRAYQNMSESVETTSRTVDSTQGLKSKQILSHGGKIERPVPRESKNDRSNQRSKISYGILLLDQSNHVLVIKRPVSYAFSSFFNYLCMLDHFNYDSLLSEVTLDERQLLKDHWTVEGLEPLIHIYLDRAFPSNDDRKDQSVKRVLERKFKLARPKMQTRWNCLIQIIDLNQLPSISCPRIYGFPKVHGPEKKKWSLSREQFFQEVGSALPSDCLFKQWLPVNYCSNDGFQYNFDLMVGSCQHFELPAHSKAVWISLDQICSCLDSTEPSQVSGSNQVEGTLDRAYFVPEVVEAITKAQSLVRGTKPN